MGYRYKKYQKGVYVDGHEREDVVEYQKTFLKEMEIYQKFMPIFDSALNESSRVDY
ncbi:hypothetical protein RhiirC2_800950 [Rhizophagus irregularis]|uniref:Uncharacterized protein n=1 Tax=Rhizophagus irregularis TaxID=588596 RepID=A0A2N1M308_9GLOM|nr:hypothetical protein RhiirC2_800950 [Rhizophagus irregularis]